MPRISTKAAGLRVASALTLAFSVLVVQCPAYAAFTSPWVPQSGWNTPNIGSDAKPTLGDLDGNGTLDVLIGGGDGTVKAYQNTGAPGGPPVWTRVAAWDVPVCGTGRTEAAPALVDLDGDGDLDVVVGYRDTMCVYRNDGGPGGPPVWTRNTAWELTGLTSNQWYAPAFADLNGDGKVDMILGESGQALAYENTGTTASPTWTPMPDWNPPYFTSPTTPTLADLDGDGRVDLLMAGYYGTVFAFKNTGTVTSPAWTSIGEWFVNDPNPAVVNKAGAAVGDLNGDGKPDLLYGDVSGVAFAYENTGLPQAAEGTAPPPPPPGIHTVTENFDTFVCAGAWQPAPTGPNSSYVRNCSNGWTAYAEDVANSDSSPPQAAGPVGSQNAVVMDNVNGPSDTRTNPPLGSAQLHTAPDDTVRGVLWLLKTYPVVPGQPIQTIQSDFRIKVSSSYSEYVGIVVFDGTVTDPSGQTSSGVPLRSDLLAADVRSQGSTCGANVWCPWNTASVGGQYVVPTHSTITIGFKVSDIRTIQTSYADFDNLTISGVVTPTQSAVPVGDTAQLWAADYQASGSNDMAEPAAVAIDASGNVYVAGNSYDSNNYDIVVIKYDPSGNQLWLRSYNGGDADQATGISVDGAGNVYVTGRTFQSASSNDFVAMKFDASGTQQWVSTYDNAGKDDQPVAQALDASGNLYVTGSSCSATSPSTACDYVTVKFNASGVQQWGAGAGAIFDYNGGIDHAVGLGLDSADNVYVTGTGSSSSAPGTDVINTVKYDTNGNLQWTKTYPPTSTTDVRAVAIGVDGGGDSYITGWDFRGTGTGTPSIILFKYDTNDNLLWSNTYDDGLTDIPTALVLDSGGNAYITGVSGTVGNYDIVTLKYLADGTSAWARRYGNDGLVDRPAAVAVDGNGDVFVTGTLARSTGNSDFVTLQYDSSGTAKSAISYDGFSLNDTPVALAVGSDGQGDPVPVVTGASRDASGLDHIATVRYEKVLPDLTMTQVSGPASGVTGSAIDIDNTVLNIFDLAAKKDADSGAFDVGLYLAPDVNNAPDYGNLILLGTRSVANLTPGQSDAATTTVTIPATVAEGTYYLVAVADPGNVVTEEDETNNRLASAATIAVQGTLPDLIISSIVAPTSAVHGTPFNVQVTVANSVSTGTSTSFNVGIYLSSDSTITTSDSLLTSFTVSGGLAGFGSTTQTVGVTVPNSGVYYIGAIADNTNVVVEANENNNAAVNSGTPSSTQLITDTDFIAGLPGTNVAVAGTGTGGRVQLFRTVVWTANSTWNAPNVGTTIAKPALGDLNGDGIPDLLVGDGAGIIHAYQNTGSASAPVWSAAPAAWGIPTVCDGDSNNTYAVPVLADLDGDGDLDLLVGTRYHVCAYRNTGSKNAPTWTRNSAWDVTTLPTGATLPGNSFYAPAVADLDGDGRIDLMLGSSQGTVYGYRNTGTVSSPVWSAPSSSWNLASGVSRPTPRLADLDGDGDYDLMVGDSTGAIDAFRNDGGRAGPPAWTANTAWNIAAAHGTLAGPALGDLNGDGNADVLQGDSSGASFAYQDTGLFSTSPGVYTSKVVDAGTHGGYTTLSYDTTVPSGTILTVDARAGDSTSAGDSTWTPWLTDIANGGDISSLGTHRYIQYRINLSTSNASVSPALSRIQAGTQPPPPQQTTVSVSLGSGSGGGGLGTMELLLLVLAVAFSRVARRRV